LNRKVEEVEEVEEGETRSFFPLRSSRPLRFFSFWFLKFMMLRLTPFSSAFDQ
jgi:hypothetical protein